MKVPVDQIVGKYQMTGQLLLIALNGAGDGKLKFGRFTTYILKPI